MDFRRSYPKIADFLEKKCQLLEKINCILAGIGLP